MSDRTEATIELRTFESISDMGRKRWERLTGEDPVPFLSYDWLEALERCGCVRPERGWLPMHLGMYRGEELLAAAPAYVKGNNEGEFVFDHAWAQFCQRATGTDYYPKLVVAVPFTPATGPRLLVAPGADVEMMSKGFVGALRAVVERLEFSGAHVLFPETEQSERLGELGLLRRAGVQYHWTNPGYECFGDFLARFSSKRRHQIRRERKEMDKLGITLTSVSGAAITEQAVDEMFAFYTSTVNKYFYGKQYLTRGFFFEVVSRMADKLHWVFARDSGGKAIAGAFNLRGAGALYGRYWGANADVNCLHFNVCFYQGIDDCIREGLQLFEPGAGGEHKRARGFEPTRTHSLHLIRDPRVRGPVADFLRREEQAVEEHLARERAEGVLKPL